MEINYLREFVVLADVCNFQRAADMLYTTQSSLSRHIKTIETELGVVLFNRTTHKTELTEYGQIFLPFAKEITHSQYKYQVALKTRKEKDASVLNIGICNALPLSFVSAIYKHMLNKYPDIKVNIFEGETQTLTTKLTDGTCDIALIREIHGQNDFYQFPVYSEPLVALVPFFHPLACREYITLEDLRHERLLFLTRVSNIYDQFFLSCKAIGFTPDAMFKLSRGGDILNMVKENIGIAILPYNHTKTHELNNCVVLNILPQITTTVTGVCRQSMRNVSSIKRGITCIQKVKKALFPENNL